MTKPGFSVRGCPVIVSAVSGSELLLAGQDDVVAVAELIGAGVLYCSASVNKQLNMQPSSTAQGVDAENKVARVRLTENVQLHLQHSAAQLP